MTDQNVVLIAVELVVGVITALGSVPAIVAFIKSWTDRDNILDEARSAANTDAGTVDLLYTPVTELVTRIIDLETRWSAAEARALEAETRLRQLGEG